MLHVRLVHGLLGRSAQSEEATSPECDAADSEPGPAEEEPRASIREPVHVKEDARARHRDGDARCSTGQNCATVLAEASAENQRRGSVERSSRRVTARERRPECLGNRVQRWPDRGLQSCPCSRDTPKNVQFDRGGEWSGKNMRGS